MEALDQRASRLDQQVTEAKVEVQVSASVIQRTVRYVLGSTAEAVKSSMLRCTHVPRQWSGANTILCAVATETSIPALKSWHHFRAKHSLSMQSVYSYNAVLILFFECR